MSAGKSTIPKKGAGEHLSPLDRFYRRNAALAQTAKPQAVALQEATTPAAPLPSQPVETLAMRKPKLDTHGDLFIKDARILTATHGTIEKGSILVRGGKIVAIGKLVAPAGVPVIDATGKVVSPGIVDAHIHRGIDSTNEGSDAITGECRILDVLNPDSKTVWQAVASGETSALVLHGSANPVGAQSLVVKLKYGHHVNDLPIKDAPRMIKFALGENVTRSGQQNSNRFPHTRKWCRGRIPPSVYSSPRLHEEVG